ncbi:ribokinase [Anaerotignum propionicum]|uniref:Ribokinase n=1 Tax=Anaerotignum propionicum DSM 1682 TaxID=991789 RepID=A0A0X1U842_ANAPI|nr:ribokinase [Anaerotignum propionicum]AMJ41104.1 ribokinase [Anaerotignum propionicum DSM 1682]MEA5056207.1 ribokinase [Anaerotignum propionicum]SHE63635.1 ribokinase [[Clostridium] propionicum DSM 1682] [Anaerotignum propionicum DSM 1682]
MKILNFGSLNMDYVYEVDHFVEPGETMSSNGLFVNCGGKGLNQSIAAVKAGNLVYHAGFVGKGGEALAAKLGENHVDVSLLMDTTENCGHAIIQVDKHGQNCILLYGGTNQLYTKEYISETLDKFGNEGLVLLQNETNLVGYMIEESHKRGLKIAFNAAPMNEKVLKYPLELLDWLIVNEVEGRQIAGCEKDEEILPVLKHKYPKGNILLTLGSRGAICYSKGETYKIGCHQVEVVDTTAAGDTFSGYFLYGILNGESIPDSLLLATTASALAIGKKGASDSVPLKEEVDHVLKENKLGSLAVEKID